MNQGKGNHIVKYLLLAVMILCMAIGGYFLGDTDTNSSAVGAQSEDELALVAETEQVEESTAGFRNAKLLNQHYQKHGIEMGFASAEEYEEAAKQVVVNPEALHKTEAEDGDDVYYVEATNEFVIVSTDGYIRTYFNPSAGIAYYNRQ